MKGNFNSRYKRSALASGISLTKILAVYSACALLLCGCGKRTIKTVIQQNGSLSKTTVNYDFVETPGDNVGQPKVPDIDLPPAANYFAKNLDKKTRGVYKQLYSGFLKFEEQIDITDKVIHKGDIGGLLELCTSTSPKISYISQNYTVSLDNDDYVTAITVKYSKTAEQAKIENQALESKANAIAANRPSEASEYEQVKYFHDMIIKNCEYSENAPNPYSAYGCLCERSAVCEGYTKAMQILCDKAGILCLPVVGKGISGNEWQPHMWNKILIDGKWYGFDLTWDDPVSDFDASYIRYDYFGINDEQMNKDHIPDEKKYMETPAADSTDANYFIQSGQYCTAEDNRYDLVYKVIEKTMSANEDYARIKCSDEIVYQNLLTEIFQNDETNAEIFSILDSCIENGHQNYTSSGYSLVKDDVTLTVTVKLSKE